MPNTTNRVKLPYILQSQSQKEVTHNSSLDLIDALIQAAIVSVSVNTPPGSPNAGDCYIIGTSPTGAWTGQAKALAYYTTGWNFITPWEGLTVWANDVNLLYTFDGTAWNVTVNLSVFQNLTMLGVNATADSTNKLSVNSAATRAAVFAAVMHYDSFTEDNDPYGEHDFGKVVIEGQDFFFKIDYYDHTLCFGSENPADPKVTTRVLTIMLASEY